MWRRCCVQQEKACIFHSSRSCLQRDEIVQLIKFEQLNNFEKSTTIRLSLTVPRSGLKSQLIYNDIAGVFSDGSILKIVPFFNTTLERMTNFYVIFKSDSEKLEALKKKEEWIHRLTHELQFLNVEISEIFPQWLLDHSVFGNSQKSFSCVTVTQNQTNYDGQTEVLKEIIQKLLFDHDIQSIVKVNDAWSIEVVNENNQTVQITKVDDSELILLSTDSEKIYELIKLYSPYNLTMHWISQSDLLKDETSIQIPFFESLQNDLNDQSFAFKLCQLQLEYTFKVCLFKSTNDINLDKMIDKIMPISMVTIKSKQ